MRKRLSKALIGSAIAALGWAVAIAMPASAGTLYTKPGFDLEWNYSIDSKTDSERRHSNNYRGLALTETDDQYIFAVSSDIDYNENKNGITHGDLFLNFSGQNFNLANGTDQLFAVRFSSENATQQALGLYSNVVATNTNITRWEGLRHYYDSYGASNLTYGSDIDTREDAYNYFYSLNFNTATRQNTPFFNGIQSGTRLGDVSMLDLADLENLGLDITYEDFNGASFSRSGFVPNIFGIGFDKSLFEGLLPSGTAELMAHLTLTEGDGVALQGEVNVPEIVTQVDMETVPEPSTLLGLGAMGLALLQCKRRRSSDRDS